MFLRSPPTRRRRSSHEIAYQPIATMDKDDNGDAQVDGSKASNDELSATGSTRAGDASELVVVLTEKENKLILRKIDKVILPILVWVYFLQILDKTILGYSALFGLGEDNHLVGNEYSIVGSVAPIAQLVWQPVSSFLIVRIPPRTLMPCLVFGWGLSQALTTLCRSFASLVVARFFLGLFEAGCLPLFSVITSQWYRRAEQPLRVAAWYGTNGLATILAALLSFLLSRLPTALLAPWQTLFLTTGLVTLATVPLIRWRLANDIPTAPFLTPAERLQALERLRANQTGVGTTHTFQRSQAWEALAEPKTYLFLALAFANNLGAQVTNTFGPLILRGLGFDSPTTTLLNMPFGATQYAVIVAVALFTTRIKFKSAALVAITLPILAGLVVLYRLPRDGHNTGGLMTGYYLLAFIFGGNTLIVAWILANTGGQTKKAVVMGLYNAASAAGNVVGPLLFHEKDGPEYKPGLRVVLGVFVGMVVAVGLLVVELGFLNRGKARRRVAAGGPAVVVDRSMEAVGEANEDDLGEGVGGDGLEDVTDGKNDLFVYVY